MLTSLTIAIATILLFLGLTILLLELILDPQAPEFSLRNAKFNITRHNLELVQRIGNGEEDDDDEVTNTNYNIVNADVTFTVAAQNPNKRIDIMYEDTQVELLYGLGQDIIGEGLIPAFYQGHQNTTLLNLQMKGERIKLSSTNKTISSVSSGTSSSSSHNKISNLANNIGNNIPRHNNNNIGTNLLLSARAMARFRIKVGWWKSGACLLQLLCDAHIPSSSFQTLNNGNKSQHAHVRSYGVHLLSHKCKFNLKSLKC